MDLLHFKDNASNRDVISLFSGAMGLDIGLTKAGLNVVIGQDFDPACVATMRVNGHTVLEGDIREIDESVRLLPPPHNKNMTHARLADALFGVRLRGPAVRRVSIIYHGQDPMKSKTEISRTVGSFRRVGLFF